MSREADILFCKIAITAGMVSEQQAQKVLAFVEKKERETGRRPIVAAVFTKHQLMTTEQVQKVKAAVAKRTGAPSAVHRPAPAKRPAGGGAGRRRERGKPARRPVDQQTLIMGAGFGVVFVGVLITIFYLYLVSGGSRGSEVSSAGSTPTPTEVSAEKRMGITPKDKSPPVPEDKELPRDIVLDISQRMSDILTDRIDNPARARTAFLAVKDFIDERRRQGYIIPEDIESRLREMESGFADAGAEEPPVEESPVDDAAGENESKAQPPVEKSDSGGDQDVNLDDLNLDDLEDLDNL